MLTPLTFCGTKELRYPTDFEKFDPDLQEHLKTNLISTYQVSLASPDSEILKKRVKKNASFQSYVSPWEQTRFLKNNVTAGLVLKELLINLFCSQNDEDFKTDNGLLILSNVISLGKHHKESELLNHFEEKLKGCYCPAISVGKNPNIILNFSNFERYLAWYLDTLTRDTSYQKDLDYLNSALEGVDSHFANAKRELDRLKDKAKPQDFESLTRSARSGDYAQVSRWNARGTGKYVTNEAVRKMLLDENGNCYEGFEETYNIFLKAVEKDLENDRKKDETLNKRSMMEASGEDKIPRKSKRLAAKAP
jgi:hypothetical protein